MPDGLDLSFDVLPQLSQLDLAGIEHSVDERDRLVDLLRRQAIECRNTLQHYNKRLSELEAVAAGSAAEGRRGLAADVTHAILKWERTKGDNFRNWIVTLRHMLTAHGEIFNDEARRLAQENLQFAGTWLTLLKRLQELGNGEGAVSAEILRAHPLAGEIDYVELSREHMTRYPKIRAALAE